MNTTNNNTFAMNIATIKRSGLTIRTAVQNAIIQALCHFSEHGDTIYLTRLMDAATSSRAIRTATLLGFIKAHANVAYVNSKHADGSKIKVFRKTGKDVEIQEVESNWWEFDNKGEARTEIDFVTQAKALLSRIKHNREALAEHKEGAKKLKSGTETLTARLESQLEAALQAV